MDSFEKGYQKQKIIGGRMLAIVVVIGVVLIALGYSSVSNLQAIRGQNRKIISLLEKQYQKDIKKMKK